MRIAPLLRDELLTQLDFGCNRMLPVVLQFQRCLTERRVSELVLLPSVASVVSLPRVDLHRTMLRGMLLILESGLVSRSLQVSVNPPFLPWRGRLSSAAAVGPFAES